MVSRKYKKRAPSLLAPKTYGGARQHMEYFAELFSSFKTVTEDVINEIVKQHHLKKHLRQSLRRMIQGGLISKNSTGYVMTRNGSIVLKKYLRPAFNPERWDGKRRIRRLAV